MTTPTTAPATTWSDALLLGHEAIDDDHEAFVTGLQALQQALRDHRTADAAAALDALADHARHHFAREDAWMTETAFPPRGCHMDEHAAVLRSLDEVRAMVAAGRTQPLASLAAALADWFPRHVHHLDSALAAWLAKRRWDARPVVLRRGAARPDTVPLPVTTSSA